MSRDAAGRHSTAPGRRLCKTQRMGLHRLGPLPFWAVHDVASSSESRKVWRRASRFRHHSLGSWTFRRIFSSEARGLANDGCVPLLQLSQHIRVCLSWLGC